MSNNQTEIEALTLKIEELESLLKNSYTYEDLSLLNYTHHFGANSEAYQAVDNFLKWVFESKLESKIS